jgi:hypothetical protein
MHYIVGMLIEKRYKQLGLVNKKVRHISKMKYHPLWKQMADAAMLILALRAMAIILEQKISCHGGFFTLGMRTILIVWVY